MIVLLFLIPNTIVPVYSQMPPGFQAPQMPKMVQGKYVNSEFGLEMIFPPGIQGFESNEYGLKAITITLGDPSTATIISGINDLPLMRIVMTPPPISKVNDTLPTSSSNMPLTTAQPVPEEMGCKTLSTESSNLGGKAAQAFTKDCFVGTGTPVKVKKYAIDLGEDSSVIISFTTPSQSKYDLNIGTFENIVKSIKFTK
jgi:hypothetical protein